MRKCILVCSLLLFNFMVLAQVPMLNIISSTEYHTATGGVVSTNGRSAFICGNTFNFNQPELLRFAHDGSIDWALTYPTIQSGMQFKSITMLNNLYVAGVFQDTAFVTAFDTSGNILWSRKLKFLGYNNGSALKIQTDSSNLYFVTGVMDTATNIPSTCITKLDLNGNIVWTKRLSLAAALADLAYSPTSNRLALVTATGGTSFLTILDTSGAVINARSYLYQCCNVAPAWDSGFVISFFYQSRPILMRIDSNGSPIWTRQFSDGSNWTAPQPALTLIDGYCYYGIYDNNSDVELLKLDSTGSIVWSKNYAPHLGYSILHAVAPDDNGNLWMLGTRSVINDEYFVGSDDTMNQTTCISFPGTLTDSIVPPYDSMVNISTQTILSSTIVMNETLTSVSLTENYACSTGTEEFVQPAIVNVYPIPASDFITFQFGTHQNRIAEKTITIRDVTGREITSATSDQNVVSISVGLLPEGMYFYEVFTTNSKLSSGKFVVSR